MRSRQKSCVPCAQAKRRCDPQTPKCPRCETRGFDCYYKNQPLRDVTQGGRVTKQRCSFRFDERSAPLSRNDGRASSSSESTTPSQREEPAWTTITGPVVGCTTLIPPQATEEELDNSQTLYFPSVGDGSDQNQAWSYVDPFLTNPLPPVAAQIDRWSINLFFRKLSTWPREFVQKLQTPFINKSLHDGTCSAPELPLNLQDAFTACAGYLARTADNHHVALAIIDRTVSRILDRDPYSISLSDHVSSLQAVVLLHVIQLWDGDIRQRGLAEARSDLIERWAMLLSSRVSKSPPIPPRGGGGGGGIIPGPASPPTSVSTCSSSSDVVVTATGNPGAATAAAAVGPFGPHHLWRDWVTQESARRVALITMGVQAIYEASRFGVCTYIPVLSKLALTVSDKPWDARDFDQWWVEREGASDTVVEYENLSRPYKEAGPQGTLPPPASPFARLLLVPCLGAAYRHVIGEKF